MGDTIQHLPTDSIPLTADEKELTGWLFEEDKQEHTRTTMTTLWNEIQKFLFLGLLFIFFLLPVVDTLLGKIIPILQSSYILRILVKTPLFLLLYWIFLNRFFLMQ